jgi:hypothetical protein
MTNMTIGEQTVKSFNLFGLSEEEMRVIRMGLDFVIAAREENNGVGKNTSHTAEGLLIRLRGEE